MTADWRAAAEAAEQFFAHVGLTVDQRLASIAGTAGRELDRLKAGTRAHRPAAIKRWVVRQLELCAQTFCRPPPTELVQLIEHLLGVDKPARDRARKNPKAFFAAASYLAAHPSATNHEIAREIDYHQKRIIAGWRNDPEFRKIAGIR
jgi:hypothetical protein